MADFIQPEDRPDFFRKRKPTNPRELADQLRDCARWYFPESYRNCIDEMEGYIIAYIARIVCTSAIDNPSMEAWTGDPDACPKGWKKNA